MSNLQELRALIEANQVRGGSKFGRAVADVIAMTAEQAAGESGVSVSEKVKSAAEWGVATKPSMTSVRFVADLAYAALAKTAGADGAMVASEVVASMRGFITESERAIASLADSGLPLFKDNAVVSIHSFSESLLYVLRKGAETYKNVTILLTESRPLRESRHLVKALADTPAKMKLYSDAGMAIAAKDADFALVGADAILSDGSFANKTGSLPLALIARHYNIPYYVAGELSKVHLGAPDEVKMEIRPEAELVDDWDMYVNGRVQVWNQFFEVTPAEFVKGYVTEAGLLTPAETVAAARKLPQNQSR